jgi:pilus assembly protein Flp/PilA
MDQNNVRSIVAMRIGQSAFEFRAFPGSFRFVDGQRRVFRHGPKRPIYFVISVAHSSGLVAGDGYRMWRNVMKSFALKVRRFMVSEDGPTAVEYAVMLALIVIVCLSAISTLGTNAKTTFTNVAASVAGS